MMTGSILRGTLLAMAIFVWGCGERAAPPVAGPAPVKPPVAVPAPAAALAAPLAVAPAGETNAAPAGAVDAGADYGKALQAVEGCRQVGDYAEAIEKLQAMQKTFPGSADEIGGLLATLKDLRRESVDLGFAVEQLGKEDPMAATVAARKLAEAGEVGKVVLRRAVRQRDERVAAGAAKALADLGDDKAIPDIVERHCRSATDTGRADFGDALRKLALMSPAECFTGLVSRVEIDPTFAQKDAVDLLVLVLEKGCGGKTNEFDRALGVGAAGRVRGYIETALAATNVPAVHTWALGHAAAVGLLMPGIRAQYYAGQNFETLVLDRVDQQIKVDERKFPYPDGRQDEISVRWSGRLWVPKPGKYTFKVASDDGNRLWVDGVKKLDQWGSPATHQVEVDVAEGFHDLVIEFQQGGGGASIHATWSGADIPERTLSDADMRYVPWIAATNAAAK